MDIATIAIVQRDKMTEKIKSGSRRVVKSALPDVQKKEDDRNVKIQKVGVNNVYIPSFVKTMQGAMQPVTVRLEMAVELPPTQKGAHMSRFVELAHSELMSSVSMRQLDFVVKQLVNSMKDIRVQDCHISAEFFYMVAGKTPETGKFDMVPVEVTFEKSLHKTKMKVKTLVQSLCPCSKEISKYGAHNQRASVEIEVDCIGWVWIEDLVALAREAASAPTYSLLKRPDEKVVTEQAYDNPAFVEDIVRDITMDLKHFQEKKVIGKFYVKVTSYESIHPHNAFAEMEVDVK